jgi:gas vesicle protein
MTTTGKIALGILGAVAAGLCIGLLVAPDKGKETRKKIKDSTGAWVNDLGRLFTKNKGNLGKQKRKMERMMQG